MSPSGGVGAGASAGGAGAGGGVEASDTNCSNENSPPAGGAPSAEEGGVGDPAEGVGFGASGIVFDGLDGARPD